MDRQTDTNKNNSPSFTDKSLAEKSIPTKSSSTAQKKNAESFVDLPLDKSITSGSDNDTISNEDNQGDYDVPIAERSLFILVV